MIKIASLGTLRNARLQFTRQVKAETAENFETQTLHTVNR